MLQIYMHSENYNPKRKFVLANCSREIVCFYCVSMCVYQLLCISCFLSVCLLHCLQTLKVGRDWVVLLVTALEMHRLSYCPLLKRTLKKRKNQNSILTIMPQEKIIFFLNDQKRCVARGEENH